MRFARARPMAGVTARDVATMALVVLLVGFLFWVLLFDSRRAPAADGSDRALVPPSPLAPTSGAPPTPTPRLAVAAVLAASTSPNPSAQRSAERDGGIATPTGAEAGATVGDHLAVAPVGVTSTPGPNSTTPLAMAATFSLGQSLCDLAVDDAGRRLYVADDGSERLLVLDAATGQLTGQFDLRDSLCSIALDERGNTVYAPTWRRAGSGRYAGSQVAAITLDSGALRTFPDDQFPSGPFFDAQARMLYVGDTAQPRLWVLDAATGATSALPVGAHVNRVALSAKTGRLYLASPQDNKVVVYDPTARRVVANLSVGQRPWGVASDPKTGAALVSSELSGEVSLIAAATDQVVRTTPTGNHPRNVAVDGVHGRFYVLNAADRTVSVLATDGTLLSTSAPLPGSEDPSGLAVASQARRVFVATKTHIYVMR